LNILQIRIIMKILLVEDNIEISDNIYKILKIKNPDFEIIQVFDGEEAIKKILTEKFDFILLDLMLPKIDGITLCKRIRLSYDYPIIMMTAKWADDDKILGLESGADDYIVKPFKIEELYLRILWLSKRLNIKHSEKIWDIEINFYDKQIFKNWKNIELKLKEFQILELIYNKDIISRTDIIIEIWWEENIFFNGNKLDVNIYNLRKKLWKKLIKTIKWFGYSINKNYEN